MQNDVGTQPLMDFNPSKKRIWDIWLNRHWECGRLQQPEGLAFIQRGP